MYIKGIFIVDHWDDNGQRRCHNLSQSFWPKHEDHALLEKYLSVHMNIDSNSLCEMEGGKLRVVIH